MTAAGELLIECKTASPKRYANGDFKVEVAMRYCQPRVDTALDRLAGSFDGDLEVVDTTYPHEKPQMLYWTILDSRTVEFHTIS